MEPAWSALVVHADAGQRHSLRLCLDADGARVLGVTTLAAALDAIEHAAFDIALVAIDEQLDAITHLLTVQPSLGVVALTGAASFDTAVEAMRRGARDCLAAPYTPAEIRAAAVRARATRDSAPAHAPAAPIGPGADVSLEALEREHIARVIARHPTLQLAARKLGIDATTLQRKRKRYGLA